MMGFLEGLKAADSALTIIMQIIARLTPADAEFAKYTRIGLGIASSLAKAVISNTEHPGRYDHMTPEEIVSLLGFPPDWDQIEAAAKARLGLP
jgi:hypothetical protein